MLKQFDSLVEMMEVFADEQTCIDHLRAIRWKDGPYCPYCGSTRVYHFSDKRNHKCGDCRKRFSIKVGTIFEDTKLPLRKWFAAIWLLTSHKKGVSSAQLARDLKITQKSAWFVLHRLRYAARTKSFNRPLKGEIEIDETFLGGKEKNKHASKRKHAGRGGKGKTVNKLAIFGSPGENVPPERPIDIGLYGYQTYRMASRLRQFGVGLSQPSHRPAVDALCGEHDAYTTVTGPLNRAGQLQVLGLG